MTVIADKHQWMTQGSSGYNIYGKITKQSLLPIILSSFMNSLEAMEKVALVTVSNPSYLHSLW